MSETFVTFFALSFGGAVNAGVIAIIPSRMNPWAPFAIIQALLALLALAPEFPPYGGFGEALLLVALMLALLVVYVWLWHREDRRRTEEMLQGYRTQQEFFEKNRNLIERRHSRARSGRSR